MRNKLVIVNIERCSELLSDPRRFSSPGRISRCSGIKSDAKRLQAYAAELALSYALSGPALLPPVYSYDRAGRPIIEGGFVSLSHTDGFAACAAGGRPVGVDIEADRRVSPRLADRILSPSERVLPHSAASGFLLEKWVAKEAYLKLTGEGLSGRMDKLTSADGVMLKGGVPAARLFRVPIEGGVCCFASETDEAPEITML